LTAAADTGSGFAIAPRPTVRAVMRANAVRRSDRERDARWAPDAWTGKTLASSLPEHRASGAATVVWAAGGRDGQAVARPRRAAHGYGRGRSLDTFGIARPSSVVARRWATGSCRGGGVLRLCLSVDASLGALRHSMPAASIRCLYPSRVTPGGTAGRARTWPARTGGGASAGAHRPLGPISAMLGPPDTRPRPRRTGARRSRAPAPRRQGPSQEPHT
jgi:hypothetical protein